MTTSRVTAVAARGSAALLGIAVWASASLFGLYILAFYAWAPLDGEMARWNGVLPELYVPGGTAANAGIGAHFAAGGVILILGSVQFLAPLRARLPAVHRWIGRLYAACCAVAGVGGLVFIAARGTVGGLPMDTGFGLYGALMLLAAVQTARHARARRLDAHRAWAVRLYALAIGSWLYRMDYGFWFALTGGIGHVNGFLGPFDVFMAFAFYLPNLAVAEAWLRVRGPVAPGLQAAGAALMAAATAFVGIGTWFFAKEYWGPAILAWIT